MKTSHDGLEKIQGYEGTSYIAYKDGGGVWTNGTGHTGPDVFEGQRVDDAQVMAWLAADVKEAEDVINAVVKVPLTQNQFDALVSFTFNLGGTALKTSTLLKKLNAGDYEGASAQFDRWVYDNGKKINGLVKRRASEKETFLSHL